MEWWVVAATVIAGTLLATIKPVGAWLAKAVADAVVDAIDEALGGVRDQLDPGPGGWGNGAPDLKSAIREGYAQRVEILERLAALEAQQS